MALTTIQYNDVIKIKITDPVRAGKVQYAIEQIANTPEGQVILEKIQRDSGTISIYDNSNDPNGTYYQDEGSNRYINLDWDQLETTRVRTIPNNTFEPSSLNGTLVHELFHAADVHTNQSLDRDTEEANAVYFANEFMNKYYGEDQRFSYDNFLNSGVTNTLFNQPAVEIPFHSALNPNPNYQVRGWVNDMLDIFYDPNKTPWYIKFKDFIFNDLSDSISAAYREFLDAIKWSRIDPLIIDLAGNGIKLDSWQQSTVLFDLDGNGTKENTGWTKANGDDAFLVIDKNNDGKINDITEMFGNRDVPGFKQLATYDSNKDGLINATDTQFNLLKLWNDKNANGVVDAGELTTLTAGGIKEISLSKYNSTANISGNMQTSISTITKTDGTVHNIHELNFGFESLTPAISANRDATLPSTFQLNIDTIVLPFSRGYGNAYSWQAAMTLDPALLAMAQDISQITPANDNLVVEKQLIYAIS